ncbi:MORC family CW-type zinc finger protein 3-like [Genypterus blacodes]|uniref:MORC family CW-type zinc finger protein 3-like n=1 Tax=Genypterus blacodes TaxID=154954 RepID=UPI003F768B19
MESLGDDAAGVASAALPSGPSTSATQTEVSKVKDEGEGKGKRKQIEVKHQTEKEKRTARNVPNGDGHAQSLKVATQVFSLEQRDVQQQGTGDTQTGGQQTWLMGVEHEEAAGPSYTDAQTFSSLHFPDMNEVQKQQDQLLELMQATAQERDLLKDQVVHLTKQLHNVQTRLQEMSQTSVKVCMHQASQTEKAEETQHYKSLFEKAKRKIDELIKEKEALLYAAEANPSATANEKREIKQEDNEIALHVDCLTRQLNQSNRERDELHLRCEELKLSRSTSRTARNSPTQAVPREARGTGAFGTASIPGASRSLVQLRQNVGHLLSYFVPALDLDQVNYECDVIDEILVQVLSDEESIVSGLRSEAKKQ